MDLLKERIQQSRGEFEIYEFDVDQGHKELMSVLSLKSKSTFFFSFFKMAAALILILSAAFLFFKTSNQFSQNGQYPQSISDELMQLDIFYTSRIEAKKDKLREKFQGDELFLQDMEMLEQAFVDLQKELREDSQSEQVLTAMIANYKMRLEILERMLDETKLQSHDENLGINL